MLHSTFQSDALMDAALSDGGHSTVQRGLLRNVSRYFRSALLGRLAQAKAFDLPRGRSRDNLQALLVRLWYVAGMHLMPALQK